MSYDISLVDDAGKVCCFDDKHHMTGGTYVVGGTVEASLNITYNYAETFREVFGEEGIRRLYGMKGSEAIPLLTTAVLLLGTKRDPNYWKPTRGNAGSALQKLLVMAIAFPHAVFHGD